MGLTTAICRKESWTPLRLTTTNQCDYSATLKLSVKNPGTHGLPKVGDQQSREGKVNREGRVLTSIQPAVMIEHNSQGWVERETNQENRCIEDESENWFSKSLGGRWKYRDLSLKGGTSGVLPARRALLGDDRLRGRLWLCVACCSRVKGKVRCLKDMRIHMYGEGVYAGAERRQVER